MSIIRIEDPDGNLIKYWIELDKDEEDDNELVINDPDDGSWKGR